MDDNYFTINKPTTVTHLENLLIEMVVLKELVNKLELTTENLKTEIKELQGDLNDKTTEINSLNRKLENEVEKNKVLKADLTRIQSADFLTKYHMLRRGEIFPFSNSLSKHL